MFTVKNINKKLKIIIIFTADIFYDENSRCVKNNIFANIFMMKIAEGTVSMPVQWG